MLLDSHFLNNTFCIENIIILTKYFYYIFSVCSQYPLMLNVNNVLEQLSERT